MQEPLVSILIPFKNTADFLSECLNSIRTQTYQNWEVLAINDHSSDKSKSIVEDFSKKDTRIKVYDNLGIGIIEALRYAYSLSRGQFITRMDSDDIMTSDKIKILASSLIKFGKGHLSIGQVKYFSAEGIGDGFARYEQWLNDLTLNGNNFSEIYKECTIPSPCWMVHREDFEACGAFESDRYPEDYVLAFRFKEAGLKCIPCNEVIHLWRDYATRTSRTSEHYAQNYFLEIKLHYFLKQDNNKNKPLVVWGAGNKGKKLAQALIDAQIDFTWVCDNPKKIGKSIYGVVMKPYQYLAVLNSPQSIITVANDAAQITIHAYLKKLEHEAMKDYFFFC